MPAALTRRRPAAPGVVALTGGSDASGPVLTKAPLSSLSLLWTRARRYPWHIVGALVALTTSATTMLTVPWSFKQVIDRGFAAGVDSDAVSSSFHLLLGLVGVLAIATSVRFFLVSWVAERVVADIRNEVQDNLLEMSPPFFEDNRPAEIASRLTADTTVIEQVVGSMLSIALRNLFTLVGGVGFMFFYSAKLATMLMIGIPLVLSPILLLSRRLRRLSQESQSYVAEVGSVATEVLSAMKVVKAFGQEKRESGRIHATVEAVFTAAKRRIGIRALMTASVIGLITGAITLILWQGAVDVAEGRMTGGAIAGFVLTAGIVASSFNTLAEVYGDVLRGAGAAMRLNELLAVRPTITAPADPVPLPRPGVGRLVFDRVRFHYPTRPDTPAIADLTLTIEPGETVAVIGPSGAGKSTLFQLAQRFYDPQSGTVSLDGVNLRDADPADVRERISIVPQETILFAASARDNLRYGRWDASDEAIWAAADAANATGFLKAMPDQLDTFLGESGARLSGGQRQRIAIARALLRDPPLLLLDEATSALDSESETLVRRALERLMRGRTTVVIAHRLSTIQNADRIVVMDAGRIIEEGRHDSLQAADGLYARMARLQFEAAA